MWWDDEKIEATVDRQYVLSHLLPDEQKRLDQALGFGDGLTDDTYMDWIDQKAKRIFLILVDLGVPDQIFGVIDDSWDDDDLPIPQDQVSRLKLTYDRDPKFERKFYQHQFKYLLRHIHFGDTLFYGDDEVVPLEVVDKRPVVGLPNNHLDKVCSPSKPEKVLLRRKIPLGPGPGQMPEEEFLASIEEKRAADHKHLVTVWASYIHQDNGYILLTPVSDGTLKSALTALPPSIKIMAKRDRRILFLNWLHCLASALDFLHGQGLAHRKIRPSNVMMDIDNNIFLNDSGLLTHHQVTDGKKSFNKESYDYAAPEQWGERTIASPPRSNRPFVSTQARNAPPPATTRSSMLSDQPAILSPSASSTTFDTDSMYTIPFHPLRPDPQKSDIFSLGCVFLDVVTLLMKRPSRSFSSHRSVKNKTPGRGGGLPDSSFHKNLGQVQTWIEILVKDASKKEDRIFRSVSHILEVVARMLSPNPSERPDAQFVGDRLGEILTRICGIERVCCGSKTSPASPPSPSWPLPNGLTIQEMAVIEGEALQDRRRSGSFATSSTARSSSGSRSGNNIPQKIESKKNLNQGAGMGKVTPKARAWKAPVYAEVSFG